MKLFVLCFTMLAFSSFAQKDHHLDYIYDAIEPFAHNLTNGTVELSELPSEEADEKKNLRITLRHAPDLSSDNKLVWTNAQLIYVAYKAILAKNESFNYSKIECLDVAMDEYQELDKRIWFTELQLAQMDKFLGFALISLEAINKTDTVLFASLFDQQSADSDPSKVLSKIKEIQGNKVLEGGAELQFFVIFKQKVEGITKEIYHIGLVTNGGANVLKFYFNPECKGKDCILGFKFN
ncbi:MAG: hypothetical protein MRY83_15025 [Flavobacteriales bacterium]|nr:hypothetical protein [Flavobacteriales bacterium]